MARHKADWSELYPEILISIAGRLETRDDVRHFRTVCQKWRLAIPQFPPNLPCLSPLFPHKFSTIPPAFWESLDFNLLRIRLYFPVIVASTTFLLQPRQPQNPNRSKPWLVTVEELKPGKFLLRKPLTRLAVKTWYRSFPKTFNLCDFNVREICKAYNFRYSGESPNMYFNDWWRYNNKLILFFNPASVCPIINDCYALLLHDKGKLLCVRLRDEGCMYLECGEVSRFDDIVNYKDGVWAIDRKGKVYVIHYSDALKLVMFSNDTVCTCHLGNTRKRLVESSQGGLYLIDRYYDGVDLIRFRVYKLNEGERKWHEVKSLNGRILFVSTDCCFFASAKDFPGCVGNCIFFPKHHFPHYNQYNTNPDEHYFKGATKGLEIGVFHLDNDETGPISTYPGYSNIFWPPPKGLFRNPSSSMASPLQVSKSGANFRGVDVISEFVPILERIWPNRGNAGEGSSNLCSSRLVAKALDFLVEVVSTLRSTPGKSLDQFQADILRNFQGFQFTLDWLVPNITEALACQRSKPLVDCLSIVERMKASLLEIKRNHLEQLAIAEIDVDRFVWE